MTNAVMRAGKCANLRRKTMLTRAELFFENGTRVLIGKNGVEVYEPIVISYEDIISIADIARLVRFGYQQGNQ
jgi:hypothetical protein